MSFVLKPWHLLLLVTSATTQRENEPKIEFLLDEIRCYQKRYGKRLRLSDDGFLNGKKYVLMDRDAKFTAEFRTIIQDAGTECVLLPPRSPNLNAHVERFMLSIKSECLDKLIFFGEKSLRNALNQFLIHYHTERNHQSFGNTILQPGPEVGNTTGKVECRERLGGLLNYYHRRAA